MQGGVSVDFATSRRLMVESQIRTNKVTDQRVIDALLAVPREAFVPDRLRTVAYVDEDLRLKPGRYLIEPMVFARLLQMVEPKPGDRALVLACGSGYSAAVLAHVVAELTAIESDADLAAEARARLAEHAPKPVTLREAPAIAGAPDRAPFDVIVIEGAVAGLPDALSDQLAEGGRLAAVIRPVAGPGRATLIEKHEGVVSSRVVFDAGTPLLPGFTREEGFVF